MLSCDDIARYFLAQTDEDAGDLISNPKLQKLVYYAQGFCLALYDRPLFPESLEAWIHGPVVPELYRTYQDYAVHPIPRPNDLDFSRYENWVKELLDEVYAVYGQFSAWKLRNMTQEEPPWKNAVSDRGVIDRQAMKEYFGTLLVRDEAV